MNWRRALIALLSLLLLAACQRALFSPETVEQRFARWHRDHAAEAGAYQDWLASQGVAEVMPLSSLLRTSRRWQRCGAAEFAVPPQAEWAGILPTLRLLRQLQTEGLVDGRRIRSGWRDAHTNACSGGSTRSQHLRNRALDLDLDPAVPPERLCGYWRRHGPALRMGLGFYSTGHIHIDTAGFRTWGNDHTRRTSLCMQPPHSL